MGEYTEQEIEMLARFDVARYDADDWDTCSDEAKAKDRKAVLSALTSEYCPAVLRAAARLMREAREQGATERAKYRADDVVLARSPLAASCVRQGVTAQAAANAFEHELHDMTQEFIRYRTTYGQPAFTSLATDNLASARADGAEEMRERIVTRLRAFGDPDVCDAARSVPVTFDESEKEMRVAMLRRQLSDAGDRHDRDECDRLDAEIAAIERIDE
jgi:hypothetical protein